MARSALSPFIAERPFVRANTIRCGGYYGGWTVKRDGLNRRSVVYSAGIGRDISFDRSLIGRYRLELHAFDPTPTCLAWLKRRGVPAGFHFHELGIGATDGTVRLAAPTPPLDYSFHTLPAEDGSDWRRIECRIMRIGSIMRMLGHSTVDLLKLDIEGAEFEVVDDILASRLDIRQLLVEFHHRFTGDGYGRLRRAVSSLKDAGYTLFAVSPRGVEYSFSRSR